MTYVALLRGINVGGKTLIKMAELRECVENLGFENVKTYINSGNIIFKSEEKDTIQLAQKIEATIKKSFKLEVATLVLSKDRLKEIIDNTPKGWGEDPGWKYNYLFLLPPYDTKDARKSIGELKPDIESIVTADGVMYQSLLFEKFGRTTSGKLASMPIYKRMTVRNHRTPVKILGLMDD